MSSEMDAIYRRLGPNAHSGKPRHKEIAAMAEGPRVLDFGCGAGDLLLLLQEKHPDWELTGIDISQVALGFALERGFAGNTICADQTNGDGLYSTIIAAQVLEHADDDVGLVRNLSNALEPGGLLIISVPNDGAIQSPDHKRVYTEDSLRELLRCIGTPALHSWPGEAARILMSVQKDVKNANL